MSLRDRAELLFRTSRPFSWVIAPAIWFSGLIHANSNARTISGILFAIALTFPTCLTTFGVNDVYDIDSDMLNPRKNNPWIHGSVLAHTNRRFILKAARVSTIIVILLALPASASSIRVLGCTMTFLFLTWIYSAPPFRLKELPILDSLSNGLICWLFWASGYVFDGEKSLLLNTEQSARNGLLVFLLGMTLHSLAAVADVKADASANHQTIATGLGERGALLFSFLCFVVAMLVVDNWSLVGMVPLAGAFTTVLLLFVPRKRQLLIRLAFGGSFVGTIIWVLMITMRILLGYELSGDWSVFT